MQCTPLHVQCAKMTLRALVMMMKVQSLRLSYGPGPIGLAPSSVR